MTGQGLSDRDRAILAFERKRFRYAGAKDEAIMKAFGMSPIRYYQVVNALIDTPAALVHDPQLVRRLQRLRDERASRRAVRRRAG